jgi:DnaJ domain
MCAPTIKPAWRHIIPEGKNLARETDFLDLYKILGLNPGCGLAEFKQAYRRRVAILHPDRRSADQVSMIVAERLQQLTALYGSAMAFERRHGRLPGAAPVRPPLREGSPFPPAHVAIAVPPRRPRVRWWLIVPTALACVVWMLWDSGWFSENTDSDTATTTSQPASANSTLASHRAATQPSSLALGMDTDAVRAI